jgi:hypothetical protein
MHEKLWTIGQNSFSLIPTYWSENSGTATENAAFKLAGEISCHLAKAFDCRNYEIWLRSYFKNRDQKVEIK